MKISIFWFRRDLRLEDNVALSHALSSGLPVLPVFIYDKNILKEWPENDKRISFIHQKLADLNAELRKLGSGLKIIYNTPEKAWCQMLEQYSIQQVFCNREYEPYAKRRDKDVSLILLSKGVVFKDFKDHVIFEPHEILKKDGDPYKIFTPYKIQWLAKYEALTIKGFNNIYTENNFYQHKNSFPELEEIGFVQSEVVVPKMNFSFLNNYADARDIPSVDGTSRLGVHLRFGTVSVRRVLLQLKSHHDQFLNELIWREFFIQILAHFPRVVHQNFKKKYDEVKWRNKDDEFKLWCDGKTGYPIVDAGMRQLNETGFMHNRVRMIAASFLCKHLLIDWKWGEAYFAEKLLDFELSSNNGNWQWVAGTGCDSAPYFRVFNPSQQVKRFDPELKYIKKWVGEYDDPNYVPIVEHNFARNRAIETFKSALMQN